MNICMSYQVFIIHIQPKQDISIPGKNENFGPYKNENLILEELDIEKDHKNLRGKSLDTKSYARDNLSERTL